MQSAPSTNVQSSQFQAAGIPLGSPLRNTLSPYWHDRVTDEGVPRPNGFYRLAASGKISVVTPAYVRKFGDDGESVVLDNGSSIRASAVVLATGYNSSWPAMFDGTSLLTAVLDSPAHPFHTAEETQEELGLKPRLADHNRSYYWDYQSLRDSPPLNPDAKRWSSSMYRGIVPAKNIQRRDFAVNGAIVRLRRLRLHPHP